MHRQYIPTHHNDDGKRMLPTDRKVLPLAGTPFAVTILSSQDPTLQQQK